MYYVVFGFLYLLSLLPFFILYGIADFFFLIFCYVIRYRRETILNNLRNAFPDKSEKELSVITRKFYRNFMDNWIETIKLMSIGKKALNKRITGNYALFDQLYGGGKALQANMGHFFNWEIMTLHAGINQPFPYLVVYLPQASKTMNRLLIYIRSRWGNPQLPATDMAKAIIPWRNKKYLLGLGADQNPSNPKNSYWLYFLGRPTAFLKGPERLSRLQDLPVVMMTTTKPRRGHYHFDYFLLAEDPKALPDGHLMREYVRHLEENIRLQPEIYLWSHKRWKHGWKKEYEKLWVDVAPFPATS